MFDKIESEEEPHMTDEKNEKPALNPEIIRRAMKKKERDALCMGVSIGLLLIVPPLVLLVRRLLTASGEEDTTKSVLLFSLCMIFGVIILARAIGEYRRAPQKELIIERDTVSYVETDRPCTTRNGGRTRGPVYEEYLHFKSGREVQVDRYKYRESDDEDFLLVSYAAEPNQILWIYRLKDYNWQA